MTITQHLQQLDQGYLPFANRVSQMAEEFEDQSILMIVERSLQTISDAPKSVH